MTAGEDISQPGAGRSAPAGEIVASHDELIVTVVAWKKWQFDDQVRRDVAQTIREHLLRALDTFDGQCPLDLFIKRICVYKCIDEVRRQIRQRKLIVTEPRRHHGGPALDNQPTLAANEGYCPIRDIVRDEQKRLVRLALAEFEEACRQVIRRFYYEKQSYQTMAADLGINISTVGTRLARCLRKLRNYFEEQALSREDFSLSHD